MKGKSPLKGSRGFVSEKFSRSIAIGLALIVSLYFFAPTLLSQAHRSTQHLVPDVAQGSDTKPLIPVDVPLPVVPQKTTYSVYFNNLKLDHGNDCSEVHPVDRTIDSSNPQAAVLISLMQGPTQAEKAQGYSSAFSDKTSAALQSLSVRNGIAAVSLADIRKVVPNVSSSCGSQAFMSAVEKTLTQFDDIHQVIFAIEGSPKKFYNWVQMSCGVENNNCDASMFK